MDYKLLGQIAIGILITFGVICFAVVLYDKVTAERVFIESGYVQSKHYTPSSSDIGVGLTPDGSQTTTVIVNHPERWVVIVQYSGGVIPVQVSEQTWADVFEEDPVPIYEIRGKLQSYGHTTSLGGSR